VRNEAVTRALAGFEGSAVDTNTSGTEALYSFKSLKSVDWLLVAVLPIEEAFVPIRRAQQRLVSIIIVASLLLIPAFWAIAWILLNPLSALREKIERVRHLPEIYTPVLAHRRDEVGMLARAFNELVHSISEAGRQHQKSEAHLRAITDNIPALIAYIDADERYRFVNQTFLDWYGKTREQAIGKSLREVVGESIYSEIGPKLKQVLAGQRVTYQRAMIETTVPRTIEASWQPDFDEKGRVVGCYVLTHDITEHKHAELRQRQFSAELEDRVRDRTAELEASNSELASFAYSIAHDFRTPLRAMDGYSAMLQAEHASALSEEGKAYVGRIRAASIRLAALIDDLLRLAQLTQRELTRETVDLSALARTSLRTIQSGEPGRVVEVSIAPDLFVNGDKALLGSMMNELLGNAWKFTGRRLDAKIEIGVRDHEGEKAFFVRDNGAGFDMAYAEKLFTPFQRLHGINEFPGSGVGLALAARIIERHGGRIWPESAPGEGATFVFVLPF
jgi:PAS domain S-box-containing protein